MKIGIIGRMEGRRGIGVQSWEMAQHLDPAKVLLVDVGAHEQYPLDLADRYPRATVTRMGPDGTLPERLVRRWLYGLDVVIFVESPYDWDLCDWARQAHVATVNQCNPEFYRHGIMRLPWPDAWWAPTTWRMSELPPGTVHVPVPVALERFAPPAPRSGPVRFLHPVGKWAYADRNGTETFVRATQLAARTNRLDATITCLHDLPHECAPGGDWVAVQIGGVENYWDAYTGYDVMVLPRRYGGLSLGVQESMAAGLAVVMPDVSPNTDCWPVVPVAARMAGKAAMPAGQVPLAEVNPDHLLDVMVRLADNPDEVADWQEKSLEWAEAHSWERMVPVYMEHLERVIAAGPGVAPPYRPDNPAHNPFAARRPAVPDSQPYVPPTIPPMGRRARVVSRRRPPDS